MRNNVGALGVDVSDFSIEIAQVHLGGGKEIPINGYGRAALPAGVVREGRVLKPDVFSETVRGILNKPSFGKFDGRQVVLSMPEHQCYHQSILIDGVKDTRLPYTIIHERLQTVMPLDLEELAWDWTMVRQEGRKMYAYVFAVPHEVLAGYSKAFQLVGLSLRAVEPQVVSAGRALWSKPFLDQPMLFLDIGAIETTAATVDDLGIHQSSVIHEGTEAMVDELSKELKLDRPTSVKVLLTIGLRNLKHPHINAIHNVIKRHVRAIVEEAQQHLTYYHAQPHINHAATNQLAMLGGGSLIPGLPEIVSQHLKLALLDVPAASSYKPPLSKEQSALYSTALGAARRVLADDTPDVNALVTRRAHKEEVVGGVLSRLRGLFGKPKA